MREILFRGKRLDNGEWVYGDLENCKIRQKSFIHTYTDDGKYHCQFEVDPDTVGQYTGLQDKDGNEIYDCDIMAIKTRISGLYDYRRVQYNDIKGAWTAVADHICHIWSFLYELNDDYIVIGNIHDNPELLKGGDK